MTDGLLNSSFVNEDIEVEYSLRPRIMAEYIGQGALKESMEIYIGGAKARGECLDHVLLYGQPGLGKTTFASVIANEMGVKMRVTSGPAIAHGGDLASLISSLEPGDVLFIDEIHRLNTAVEEVLYPAMEDFVLDIMMGKGPGAKSLRIDLPHFTLIGATTRYGNLSSPLRDRFGIVHNMQPYTVDELMMIISRSARILGVDINEKGAEEIAKRSRSTPRIANRLLKRARDYAQVRADGIITGETARAGLDMLGIDYLGLDDVDRKILLAIIEKYSGGPVGIDTIAATTGEDSTTVEDVYEPFLLQLGFLARTPRGRVVTSAAYAHLGLKHMVPQSAQIAFE